MVFQWQVHRYNPPFCERHRRGYETEGCLRIEFKPHKNKRLPAASCTETSWIATIFLKSDRFIQPDSRCVLCYDLQLYLQVSRLLRAFDARKRKSLPDAAPPVGFFNGDAEVRTMANLFLVINRISARCSGNPGVNERRNFDGIFAFAARLQKFCFLLDGERIFLRIGQKIVRFCMREIKSAEHFGGISFTRSAKDDPYWRESPVRR